MSTDQSKLILFFSFFSIYIIWGSTYLANAYGVDDSPPFIWSGTRFILASLIIFVIMKVMGKSFQITKKEFINASIAGFMFLTIGNGLMCWALQYIDSGFMSLMVSAQPLILLIMIWVWDKKPPQVMSIAGTILGMVGMYLLINQTELISTTNEYLGLLMILICLISWGIASLFVARVDIPKNHFLNAGIQMGVGGTFLILISLCVEDVTMSLFTDASGISIFCMFYLVIFGSIFAFTAFNYLLQFVAPEKVATSTYINPIVALALGWYFRDELITNQSILATFILLTGVYFINTEKFKKKKS